MNALILLAVLVVLSLIALAVANRPAQGKRLTRPERKELAELRQLKRTLRTAANEERIIDPSNSLAAIVADEINSTERRLES